MNFRWIPIKITESWNHWTLEVHLGFLISELSKNLDVRLFLKITMKSPIYDGNSYWVMPRCPVFGFFTRGVRRHYTLIRFAWIVKLASQEKVDWIDILNQFMRGKSQFIRSRTVNLLQESAQYAKNTLHEKMNLKDILHQFMRKRSHLCVPFVSKVSLEKAA